MSEPSRLNSWRKPKKEAESFESVFRASVRMLEPWSDTWIKRPTVDRVLEAFADAIRNGQIDKIFQVEIRKVSREEVAP
jgi:hypothetical protein